MITETVVHIYLLEGILCIRTRVVRLSQQCSEVWSRSLLDGTTNHWRRGQRMPMVRLWSFFEKFLDNVCTCLFFQRYNFGDPISGKGKGEGVRTRERGWGWEAWVRRARPCSMLLRARKMKTCTIHIDIIGEIQRLDQILWMQSRVRLWWRWSQNRGDLWLRCVQDRHQRLRRRGQGNSSPRTFAQPRAGICPCPKPCRWNQKVIANTEQCQRGMWWYLHWDRFIEHSDWRCEWLLFQNRSGALIHSGEWSTNSKWRGARRHVNLSLWSHLWQHQTLFLISGERCLFLFNRTFQRAVVAFNVDLSIHCASTKMKESRGFNALLTSSDLKVKGPFSL